MGRQVTASPRVASCSSQVFGVRKVECWVNGLMAPAPVIPDSAWLWVIFLRSEIADPGPVWLDNEC